MVACPLGSLCVWINYNWLLQLSSHWKFHHFLNFIHPILNIFLIGVYIVHKVDFLLFRRKHGNNVFFVVKLNSVDVLKDFLQVRLHCCRFLCLRQNFKQVIIRKEVKSGEFLSFLLQILIQRFLDVLQFFICISEFLQQAFSATYLHNVFDLLSKLNVCLPDIIYRSEFFALSRKLFRNVTRIKYWLKIHPVALTLHPFFHHIRNHLQLAIPSDNLFLKWFFKGTKLDNLGIDQMFIKSSLNLVISSDNRGIALVRGKIKLNVFPNTEHLCKHSFNVKFLWGLLTDFNTSVDMLQKTDFQNCIKRKFRVFWIDILPDEFGYLCPMPFLHTIFSQGNHQRKFRLKFLHVVFDSLTDWGNVRHGLVLEIFVCIDYTSETFLNELFCSICIDSFKLVVHPNLDVSIPAMYDRPQSVVRSELLCDLLESWVICLFNTKQ